MCHDGGRPRPYPRETSELCSRKIKEIHQRCNHGESEVVQDLIFKQATLMMCPVI
jgi:hypothetical protein